MTDGLKRFWHEVRDGKRPRPVREQGKPPTLRLEIRAPHGVSPDLFVTIHHNGMVEMREARRRKVFVADLGRIYVSAIYKAANVPRRRRG